MSSDVLHVVNNASCVQDKCRSEKKSLFVIKSQDFFDQLRFYAFLSERDLKADNEALFLIVSAVLAKKKPQEFLKTSHYVQLINEIFRSPKDVQEIVKEFPLEVAATFSEIILDITRRKIVDQTSSLKKAVQFIAKKQQLPFFLRRFSGVYFENLVKMSDVENNAVKVLRNKGLVVEHIDAGCNMSNLVADKLVIDKKLQVHICLEKNIVFEARWLAGIIAQLRLEKVTPKIGVGFRVLDERSLLFADALASHGLVVKDSSKRKLSSSVSGKLLLDLFFVVVKKFPKALVLQILSHPGFKQKVNYIHTVAGHLSKTGLKSDVEDLSMPEGAYSYRLQRLWQIASLDEEKALVQQSIDAVLKITELKNILCVESSLKDYVDIALKLLKDSVAEDLEGFEQIQAKLQHATRIIDVSEQKLSLYSFYKWLEKLLARHALPALPCLYYDAVEILPLDKLAGRKFDYVALPDLVHGRMPKNFDLDVLLKEEQRAQVNESCGEKIFALSDDVWESERLVFVNAIKSATKGLLFTSAQQDQSKKEQAQSEYFDMALEALGETVEGFSGAKTALKPTVNQWETKFSQAKNWTKTKKTHQLEDSEIDSLELFSAIRKQRDDYFRLGSEGAIEEQANQYAFKSDASVFRRRFAKYLGLNSENPLSDTRIESLARCRFRGFVEGMLKVDTLKRRSHDIDARVLGQLAHKVLEKFFVQSGVLSASGISPKQRQILTSLLYEQADEFLNKEASGHREVMWAYVSWLDSALQRLLSNMAKNPVIESVAPKAFELAIGVQQNKRQSGLEAIKMPIGNENLYFGGVIDRVDEGRHARVVVDYKLSNSASIRLRVEEKRVFKSHFQIPLYLKLLEYHRPTGDDVQLYGYLVSIAEGTVSPVLGLNRTKDLKKRILDDHAEEGLARSLYGLLGPVLQGTFPADVGDQCSKCNLKRICRAPAIRPGEEV